MTSYPTDPALGLPAEDIDYLVDGLLARWHEWHSRYELTKGYRSKDSTCKDAQSAWSPYDRDNGVPEQNLENDTMKAVDRAIARIESPWRTVIVIEARNIWSTAAVWSSPRLPDGEEYEVLRLEARNKLLIELQREGCVGG